MVTTSTQPRDYRDRPVEYRDTPVEPIERRERGASAWLWALLILALVAVPAWWWIRNSQEPVAPATTPTQTTDASPAQTLPEPASQRPATMVRRTEPRTGAVRNHEARPLASNAVPVYPASALRAGVEGGVTARLQVNAQGQVTGAEIVERTGTRARELDRAVLAAVRDWRFEPAMRDGRAVASVVNLPVDFRASRQ